MNAPQSFLLEFITDVYDQKMPPDSFFHEYFQRVSVLNERVRSTILLIEIEKLLDPMYKRYGIKSGAFIEEILNKIDELVCPIDVEFYLTYFLIKQRIKQFPMSVTDKLAYYNSIEKKVYSLENPFFIQQYLRELIDLNLIDYSNEVEKGNDDEEKKQNLMQLSDILKRENLFAQEINSEMSSNIMILSGLQI